MPTIPLLVVGGADVYLRIVRRRALSFVALGLSLSTAACQAFLDFGAEARGSGDAGQLPDAATTPDGAIEGGLDARAFRYDCGNASTLCADFDTPSLPLDAGFTEFINQAGAVGKVDCDASSLSPPCSLNVVSTSGGFTLLRLLQPTPTQGIRLSLSFRLDAITKAVRPFAMLLSKDSTQVNRPRGVWPRIVPFDSDSARLDLGERIDENDAANENAPLPHPIARDINVGDWVHLDVEWTGKTLTAYWNGERVLEDALSPSAAGLGYPWVEVGMIYSGEGAIHIDDVRAMPLD